MLPFSQRLAAGVRRLGPACVGIDPHPDRLPTAWGPPAEAALRLGRAVISAARGRVCAVKPQFAFFEALGPAGMQALATVCVEAREAGLLVVGDAKRGDIGSTATAYAAATLASGAPFHCDALTVSPFCGPESLAPFVTACERWDSGIFVLVRTSNPGSDAFQLPVLEGLAAWITGVAPVDPDGFSSVGAVVGATHADELAALRERLPHAWMLVPGYGAQGAGAADARPAFRPDGLGALVPSARAATFPSGEDPSWERDPEAWIAARVDRMRADLG